MEKSGIHGGLEKEGLKMCKGKSMSSISLTSPSATLVEGEAAFHNLSTIKKKSPDTISYNQINNKQVELIVHCIIDSVIEETIERCHENSNTVIIESETPCTSYFQTVSNDKNLINTTSLKEPLETIIIENPCEIDNNDPEVSVLLPDSTHSLSKSAVPSRPGVGSNIGECVSLMLFDVLLPIADVYGDTSLVIPWYLEGHYMYAMAMTIPMLLNYIFTSVKWWSFEEKKHKWWSWILVLFQLWQPWRATKVFLLLYKNDDKAHNKKKEMMRDLSSIEPFLESLPAVSIMTILWVHGLGQNRYPWNRYDFDTGICNNTPSIQTDLSIEDQNFCAVFGGFGGHWRFFTTYGISVLAASLGITKFLQHGPCAILSTNGILGGMLTWRFLLAFMASMLALLTKGLLEGILVRMAEKEELRWRFLLLFVSLCVVPNLSLAIASIAKVTGWNKRLIKVMMDYPAILLLPVFSNFVVGSRRSSKCKDSDGDVYMSQFIVSRSMTAINTILTLFCYIVTIVIADTMRGKSDTLRRTSSGFAPFVFLKLLATVGFIYPDKICCPCCCPYGCFELNSEYTITSRSSKDIEMK